MPDPRFLYIMSAVVLVALVAWVAVVLLRAPPSPPAAPSPGGPGDPKHPTNPAAPSAKRAQSNPEARSELRNSRSRLDSHLEIQDEPAEGGPNDRE
jgi:hypothetical protein